MRSKTMAHVSIPSLVPNGGDLLELEVEEVAGVLLILFAGQLLRIVDELK